ncbi:MAG: signal transduction histidine kinase [Hyphomicrobiaceae bacterium]
MSILQHHTTAPQRDIGQAVQMLVGVEKTRPLAPLSNATEPAPAPPSFLTQGTRAIATVAAVVALIVCAANGLTAALPFASLALGLAATSFFAAILERDHQCWAQRDRRSRDLLQRSPKTNVLRPRPTIATPITQAHAPLTDLVWAPELGPQPDVDEMDLRLDECALFTPTRSMHLRRATPNGEHAVRAEIDKRVRIRTLELEETIETLRNDKSSLRSRVAELEAFSYSVAHDLRSPLRTVHGFGELFLEDHADEVSEEGCSYVKRMLHAALGMGDVIDAFLTLGKMSRAPMKPETLNLAELAAPIVENLRGETLDREVAFVCNTEVSAWGDQAFLSVLLTNLLENAWKFTGETERGRIELGVARRANKPAVYFVRDNGAGFDSEAASALFRPFERLHESSRFDGSGVGLTTVARIVDRHGGRVWAEGAPGAGATIYFTLPQPEGQDTELDMSIAS